MLEYRLPIIENESIFNNMIVHYMVGFFLLYSLTQIRFTRKTFSLRHLVLGGFIGWIFADVVSYLAHLFTHTEKYERLIFDENKERALFDIHHYYTLNYSYLNNVELIMIVYPVFVPLLFVLCLYHFVVNKKALQTPLYVGFFVSTCVFGLLGGYFHKWAHERSHHLLNNSVIRFLQYNHVILNNKAHKQHHSGTQTSGFGLVNGASHGALDSLYQQYLRRKTE